VREVPVSHPVADYIVRLVEACQPDRSPSPAIRRYLRFGSSPRGAQAALLGAKVAALRQGRFSPGFADVRAVLAPALRHRLLLNFEGESDGINPDDLVAGLVKEVEET